MRRPAGSNRPRCAALSAGASESVRRFLLHLRLTNQPVADQRPRFGTTTRRTAQPHRRPLSRRHRRAGNHEGLAHHERLRRQVGEQRTLIVHHAGGIQHDVDTPCLGGHRTGVLPNSYFVEYIDLCRLDLAARCRDVVRDRVESSVRSPDRTTPALAMGKRNRVRWPEHVVASRDFPTAAHDSASPLRLDVWANWAIVGGRYRVVLMRDDPLIAPFSRHMVSRRSSGPAIAPPQ
jgi:hypothetical protein